VSRSQEAIHEVTADETGRAGNEDLLHGVASVPVGWRIARRRIGPAGRGIKRSWR
jgi:hypothetical protein